MSDEEEEEDSDADDNDDDDDDDDDDGEEHGSSSSSSKGPAPHPSCKPSTTSGGRSTTAHPNGSTSFFGLTTATFPGPLRMLMTSICANTACST